VSFAACPLEFHAGARLGVTRVDGPLDVELPEGSYLLVFRKAGHLETRFPAVAPGSDAAAVETVRLYRAEEVPSGFVAIAAGPLAHGGDAEAFQSPPRGVSRLGDFFISRFETTTEEYLRFVNDPEVLARTDDEGSAEPGAEVRAALPRRTRDGQSFRVRLIPRSETHQGPWWERRDGAWRLRQGSSWTGTRPVLGLSYLAALEYAAWRTRQAAGRWRFRLPTDLEWEKAARGVDRRIYPWGDYLVWSYRYSKRGMFDPRGVPAPDVVGAFAEDESVYGVRDMAGSLQEATSGAPLEGERYVSMRGGHWSTDDAYFFRLATRNGLLPESPSIAAGIRLVAEPVTSQRP
jgi:serine/threonine-protein kinase